MKAAASQEWTIRLVSCSTCSWLWTLITSWRRVYATWTITQHVDTLQWSWITSLLNFGYHLSTITFWSSCRIFRSMPIICVLTLLFTAGQRAVKLSILLEDFCIANQTFVVFMSYREKTLKFSRLSTGIYVLQRKKTLKFSRLSTDILEYNM